MRTGDGEVKHMDRKNKILIVILVLLFIVVFSMIAIMLNINEQKRGEKAIEYLSQFPKNENIIYVDRYNKIYLHDRTIEPSKSIDGVNAILYVTANNIFYYKHDTDIQKTTIYRTDYNYFETEIVYSYQNDNVFSISMPDANTIVYSAKDNYYAYFVDSMKNVLISQAEHDKMAYYENEYYSVEREAKSGYVERLKITELSTGKTNVIEKGKLDNLLKVEQAAALSEYGKIQIVGFILKDNRIYIQCWTCGAITTYLYDFKSESYSYIDSFYAASDYQNLQTFFVN